MICAACEDQEHDCCLRLLRPGTCPCLCPVDSDLTQPPMPVQALFVVLGDHPAPSAPTKPKPELLPPQPREIRHGTKWRYRKHGCRCELCRTAHAAAKKAERERAKERERRRVA